MRIGHTVLQVILQNDLGRAAEGGTDHRQLDQHLGAVPPVFHHALDRFQVPDGQGKTVQHRFGLGVDVAVGMAVVMVVLVLHRVAVHMAVAVIVIIYFSRVVLVFVHMLHAFQFEEK